MLTTVALVAAGGWCRCAAGDTLNVPGDYPTIQSAIDATHNGDVVLVADGVYTGPGNRDIDFGGRLITLRSAGGPQNCIINLGLTSHRGFYFHSGETRAAVVDGFTIRQARLLQASGGAIRCDNSSPTIVHSNIVDNRVIGGNVAGGGIYSAGGSPAIRDCTIYGNIAEAETGGVRGGGIYCAGGSPTILNCTIANNFAVPAVYDYPSSYAGGLRVSGAGAVVANCAIIGNYAEYGGGASVGNGVKLINCTVTQNYAYDLGGGVSGGGDLRNCIVWGNWGGQVSGGSETIVSYSDVQGGWAGPGFNNIAEDPLFIYTNGLNSLHLRPGSPCIDAGQNGAVPPDAADLDGDGDTFELTPRDLDGSPRFVDNPGPADTGCGAPGVVDMGAYEVQGYAMQPRRGDVDWDGATGLTDLLLLVASWGSCGGCCAADLDADGTVGIVDFLLVLADWGPPDCNGNGVPDESDLADGTSQDCNGNGVPDECEDCNGNGFADQCDIASGTSTDFDGNGVPDECGVPPNNACGSAGPVGEGTVAFNTTYATTDGVPAACQGSQVVFFVQDIWFRYTPSCTGIATFSLCNAADYDSRVAVYFAGGQCPPLGGELACSDNAPGCGQTSEALAVVVQGFPYLVRVGGTTAGGPGVLTISCAPFPVP